MPTAKTYPSSSAARQPSLGELALVVAILRKQKALSRNGRKSTPRVWRQFNWRASVEDVVLEAARQAERLTSKKTGEDFFEIVRLLIERELARLMRPVGRPARSPGLIWSVLPRERTAKLTTTEKRALMRYVYGVQCGLYTKEHPFRDYRSFYSYINHRREEINKIPLARAIRWALENAPPPYDELFKGRSLGVLKTYFSRNKRTRRLPLPAEK